MVLVSTAILARLLSPDDFGVVGYALTAISFLDVISDLGIGPALIYYPEEKRTTSTGFWLNLLIGLVIFGITWLLAPLVGLYFRDNRVVTVMQVIGFVYPLRALGDTHDAILNKRLDFGRIFLPDLMQGLTKGLASVIFALLGYGAWSLIWGYLLGTLVSSITYWLTSPWSPSPIFSWQIARDLLRYGSKIIGVDIVAIFLVNLDYLLIGRYLGASVLGLYTIAFRFPDLLILQFARILSNVLFPVYTHMRQEPGSLARGFFLSTRYLALITVPLGLGLALVAYPLTTAIFSTKWEAAAPVVQALALYTLILSLGYSTGSIYKAEGRPQILTWLGLIRLAMLIPALWWAVTIAKSIDMVGWMQALVALAGTIISLYVATRMIKLPVYKLLEAISPAFLAGTVMSVVVYLVIRLSSSLGAWQQLALSIPIGGLIYLATLFTIQRELVTSSWDQFRKALQRN